MIGNYLRERRVERKMGLREIARRMHYTASYLSRVERDECEPGEECLMAYAELLELDSDMVLLIAGRVPPDVVAILARHPEALKGVLESVRRLPGV